MLFQSTALDFELVELIHFWGLITYQEVIEQHKHAFGVAFLASVHFSLDVLGL